MRCTSCGTDLIPGKRFCHACGARAAAQCPACGANVSAEFRFCPDCGVEIASGTVHDVPPPTDDRLARMADAIPEGLAHKIRAAQETIAGERKQVTVLFCDLAGSTAIAERLDPEEYVELLDEYLELSFREIYRLEGIVTYSAGDGLMALFGAPVAHEDAPQRAIRAALAIRSALATLDARLRARRGMELRARIGIHTGPVVVGAVGHRSSAATRSSRSSRPASAGSTAASHRWSRLSATPASASRGWRTSSAAGSRTRPNSSRAAAPRSARRCRTTRSSPC